MNREEQVEIALHDVHPKHEAGFKMGVKWADRNPPEPQTGEQDKLRNDAFNLIEWLFVGKRIDFEKRTLLHAALTVQPVQAGEQGGWTHPIPEIDKAMKEGPRRFAEKYGLFEESQPLFTREQVERFLKTIEISECYLDGYLVRAFDEYLTQSKQAR